MAALPRDPSPHPPVSTPEAASGHGPAPETAFGHGPAPETAFGHGPAAAAPHGAQRMALLGLGYACLGLAALGAVLPLLPTTVFLIVAAWAFGRASPALRARLLADPRIGATLRDWQQHGIVSRRAKRAAAIAMAGSWAVAALASRSLAVAAISGLCLALVGAWLMTRPSEPPGEGAP